MINFERGLIYFLSFLFIFLKSYKCTVDYACSDIVRGQEKSLHMKFTTLQPLNAYFKGNIPSTQTYCRLDIELFPYFEK